MRLSFFVLSLLLSIFYFFSWLVLALVTAQLTFIFHKKMTNFSLIPGPIGVEELKAVEDFAGE